MRVCVPWSARPCNDSQVASLVEALTDTLNGIRVTHPGLPHFVIASTKTGRSTGCTNDWTARPVVLVVGPRIQRMSPAEQLAWMLHTAAHMLSGGQSAGSQGRYHPVEYKNAAESLGLVAEREAGFGYRHTELPQAVQVFAPALIRLARAT